MPSVAEYSLHLSPGSCFIKDEIFSPFNTKKTFEHTEVYLTGQTARKKVRNLHKQKLN